MLPRTGHLATQQDRELPSALQQRFARRLGAGWSATLTTGHLPMLEDPAGLAAAITAFDAAGHRPT